MELLLKETLLDGGNVKITFPDGSVKKGRISKGEIFPEK